MFIKQNGFTDGDTFNMKMNNYIYSEDIVLVLTHKANNTFRWVSSTGDQLFELNAFVTMIHTIFWKEHNIHKERVLQRIVQFKNSG